MSLENFKNSIKEKIVSAEKTVLENDIHETIPKPVAKAIIRFGSLPFQLNKELGKLSATVLEKYNLIKGEILNESFNKKLSDNEIKHISETISKIRSLPKEEQEGKLANVKETLAWYKIELGKAEKKIVKGLLKGSFKSKSEVFEYVQSNLNHLPISYNDYGGILAMCDNYFERYQFIRKMRETMTDAEIFKSASGVLPVGNIEVIETTVGFYIRAHDLQDYTNLYFRSDDGPKSAEEQKERMTQANTSGGFKNDALTAENAKGKFFLGISRSVYNHEVQHLVYDFMVNEMEGIWSSGMFNEQALILGENFPYDRNASIQDLKEKARQAKEIVRELYERRLPHVLDMGKNEVLAYTIDNDNTPEKIYEILTDHFGLYNYFKQQQELLTEIPYISPYDIKIPQEIQEEFDKEENWETRYDLEDQYRANEADRIEEYLNTFKYEIGRQTFVKKYHEILWQGIVSIQELKKKGIDKDVIVRILTHEPLQKWPKVVRRLLEE